MINESPQQRQLCFIATPLATPLAALSAAARQLVAIVALILYRDAPTAEEREGQGRHRRHVAYVDFGRQHALVESHILD